MFLVRWLMLGIFYLIAIPVCVMILAIWIVRLVMTTVVMIFAMVLEAWRRKGVSKRSYQVIENVARVGPETVIALLKAPFQESTAESEFEIGPLLLEMAYSILFLAVLASVFIFEGLLVRLGTALSLRGSIYDVDGAWPVLAVVYVVASFVIVAYMMIAGQFRSGGLFRGLFLPIYLMFTGLVIVLVVFRAIADAAS